jgi:diguanylate cyclase (GGDEF)-like protein/PAS domain S-box-containing protein
VTQAGSVGSGEPPGEGLAGEQAEATILTERRLRAVMDAVPDAVGLFVAVRDGDGRIVDFRWTAANPRAGTLIGRTPADLIGSTMLDVAPALRDGDLLARCVAVLETGEPLSYRYESVAAPFDGVVDVDAVPLGDDDLVVVYRHVTAVAAREQRLSETIETLRLSEERFRGLVMALGEGLLLHLADGRTVACNPAAERLLGLSRQELLAAVFGDLPLTVVRVDGARLPIEQFPTAVALRTGRPCREVEVGMRRGDGPQRWTLVSAEPLLRAGQTPPYAVVTSFTDVTELHTAREALADSEERFRLAFDEALSGMTLMAINPPQAGRFIRVNRAFCDFLGYSARELQTMSFRDITHPEDLAAAGEAVGRFLAGEIASYRGERRYLHRSGATVWAAFSVTMIRNRRGEAVHAVGVFEDVSARKRAEQDLLHRALHDDLTGLPNRALLLDHLAGSLARARRSGTRVGVLFLDLDDFKAVNDGHGHAVGDEFLRQVASRIVASLRGGDTAARIGGDEFVVVCEGLTVAEEAQAVARRIEQTLGADLLLRGRLLPASVSIGIALSEDDSTVDTLLRDADAAMYRAKGSGGGHREVAAAGPREAVPGVAEIEGELREALTQGRLVVHYQPIHELDTGRLVAVDALVLRDHPQRGLLSAQDFIDVAERRGLLTTIGDLVARDALGHASRWQQRFGTAAPQVGVQVSVQQLGDRDGGRLMDELLTAPASVRELICLEITESRLPSVGATVLGDLQALAAAGVRLAVNDVGTGFAGVGYLRQVPVHELKIASSLVGGLGPDRTDTAVAAAVVALGRALGITVVAGGVRTVEQLDLLRRWGCARGQGPLWSPAVPADRIDELLAAQEAG